MMDRNTPPPPYIAGAADDPDYGCSCHLHPPCNWCVEGGRGYEMFAVILRNGVWELRVCIEAAGDVTPDAIMEAAHLVEWIDAAVRPDTGPHAAAAEVLAPSVYAAGPHHPEHGELMSAAEAMSPQVGPTHARPPCECSAIGAVGRSMSWDHSPWCPAAGGSL